MEERSSGLWIWMTLMDSSVDRETTPSSAISALLLLQVKRNYILIVYRIFSLIIHMTLIYWLLLTLTVQTTHNLLFLQIFLPFPLEKPHQIKWLYLLSKINLIPQHDSDLPSLLQPKPQLTSVQQRLVGFMPNLMTQVHFTIVPTASPGSKNAQLIWSFEIAASAVTGPKSFL